jgi:hypothetical protein
MQTQRSTVSFDTLNLGFSGRSTCQRSTHAGIIRLTLLIGTPGSTHVWGGQQSGTVRNMRLCSAHPRLYDGQGWQDNSTGGG